jgi:GSH-dependent disulfide-bond oxidoreductase
MIDFYYYKSPNGRKVLIALEEVGLPYQVHWVDISKGEQFSVDYLAISPGGKIPAIVDRDSTGGAVALFESAAILIYLADKTGKLLAPDGAVRYRTLSWLSWQIGSQGPMLGQATHFFSHARNHGIEIPYVIERYEGEARRCYETMEDHLKQNEWFGTEFSIADIALFPWTRTAKGQGIDLAKYPKVKAWSERIASRPAANVKPSEDTLKGLMSGKSYKDPEGRRVLFGDAFAKHEVRKEEAHDHAGSIEDQTERFADQAISNHRR